MKIIRNYYNIQYKFGKYHQHKIPLAFISEPDVKCRYILALPTKLQI